MKIKKKKKGNAQQIKERQKGRKKKITVRIMERLRFTEKPLNQKLNHQMNKRLNRAKDNVLSLINTDDNWNHIGWSSVLIASNFLRLLSSMLWLLMLMCLLQPQIKLFSATFMDNEHGIDGQVWILAFRYQLWHKRSSIKRILRLLYWRFAFIINITFVERLTFRMGIHS